MPQSLKDHLSSAAPCDLGDWLLRDCETARSELSFLEGSLARLAPAKRSKFLESICGGAAPEVEAKIFELLIHELLARLKLMPEFAPQVGGKTPDLTFKAGGTLFLADVFVTHSPHRTVTKQEDGLIKSIDTSQPGESRAFKIGETIVEKATKYAPAGLPLILFVCLGDKHLLDSEDVERALFGMTFSEALQEKAFPLSVNRTAERLVRVPVGGLLLPRDDCGARHTNLSAVIACDWFDTLNRKDRGKRLFCRILHHYSPKVELSRDAFGSFQQGVWSRSRPESWKASCTGLESVAARFVGDDEIIFRPYSPSDPW